MITRIDSASNSKIKIVGKLLHSKKERYEALSFVLEGYRSVSTMLELPSSIYLIREVYVSQSFMETDRFKNIHSLNLTLPFYAVADSVFNKISDVVNTQGILAVVGFSINDFKPGEASGLYLLLDSISDPGNMGTLIRSAVAAGFDSLLLSGNCVDPFNPKTIRSTMGVFAGLDVFNLSDSILQEMRSSGYDIIVTQMAGQDNLFDTGFNARTVLVVGSESVGTSDFIRQCANKSIYIPMRSNCESLNAAVAGSICMFEIANKLGRLSNNSRR